MNSITTLGMFADYRPGGQVIGGGGAVMHIEIEKPKPKMFIKFVESHDLYEQKNNKITVKLTEG